MGHCCPCPQNACRYPSPTAKQPKTRKREETRTDRIGMACTLGRERGVKDASFSNRKNKSVFLFPWRSIEYFQVGGRGQMSVIRALPQCGSIKLTDHQHIHLPTFTVPVFKCCDHHSVPQPRRLPSNCFVYIFLA